jgi:hypothetical protein
MVKGAGTPTGVDHRERAREADLGAVAANGAGEVRTQLLDKSINHSSYRIPLQVLMFFFLPAIRWDSVPTYGRFFFCFFLLERE